MDLSKASNPKYKVSLHITPQGQGKDLALQRRECTTAVRSINAGPGAHWSSIGCGVTVAAFFCPVYLTQTCNTMINMPGATAKPAWRNGCCITTAVDNTFVIRERQSVHAVKVGETGTRHEPIAFNSQSWCSESCISTDRRTMYYVHRPSRIKAYPLHHLTLPSTSTAILDKLLWYWHQCQDNGTTVCCCLRRRASPLSTMPFIDIPRSCTASRNVTHLRRLDVLRSTQLTQLSLGHRTAPSFGNSVVRRWRVPPPTHSRPRPFRNAWKAALTRLKCGK